MAAPERADDLLPELILGADFRSALRRFQRRTEVVASANALTPQRYQLMLMIAGAPDGCGQATISDLALRLQISQTTVTELVNRAVEVGLVERRPHPLDGRATLVRLTDEGERRLLAAFAELRGEREAMIGAFAELSARFRAA